MRSESTNANQLANMGGIKRRTNDTYHHCVGVPTGRYNGWTQERSLYLIYNVYFTPQEIVFRLVSLPGSLDALLVRLPPSGGSNSTAGREIRPWMIAPTTRVLGYCRTTGANCVGAHAFGHAKHSMFHLPFRFLAFGNSIFWPVGPVPLYIFRFCQGVMIRTPSKILSTPIRCRFLRLFCVPYEHDYHSLRQDQRRCTPILYLVTIPGFVIAPYRWPILSSGVGFNLRGLAPPGRDRVLASSCVLFEYFLSLFIANESYLDRAPCRDHNMGTWEPYHF